MNEIAVLSGKGGTGKTSLSAAFATLEKNLVVADCDVEAANLFILLQPENYHEERFITGHKAVINIETCINCGICMKYCRFGAITLVNGQFSISETDCDGCMLCSRLCPEKSIQMVPRNKSYWYAGNYRNGRMVHARLEPGEENSGKLVNVVREQARKTAREKGWNTIIIDGPPGTGCPAISSVTGAQKAVIVTEPTRSGFHDLKRILELTKHFKVKSYIVINKYDLNAAISNEITEWCANRNIPLAGKIPFDPLIVEAMLNCKSIVEWFPANGASKEIVKIWKKISKDE